MSGKPTAYDQKLADKICERLADGESLRAICRDDDMPTKAAVFRWLEGVQGFADQYARARETQADSLADDIVSIADDGDLDPNDRRIRIDARKWIAGKMRPKVYGDKVAVGGADDLPAIKTEDTGAATIAAYLDAIASRTSGEPSEG